MSRNSPQTHPTFGDGDIAMQQEEDDLLVAKAKTNDQSAFQALWNKYVVLIRGIVRSLLFNANNVDDVVLETFWNAFRSLHLFKGGSFKHWLCKIARNQAYSALRTRSGPAQFEDDFDVVDPQPSPEERLINNAVAGINSAVAREVISKLKHRHQQVIRLLTEGSCTVAEAAERLSMTKFQVYDSIRAFWRAFDRASAKTAKKQPSKAAKKESAKAARNQSA
jgi:RNA polymerase sigma factor (sigma-70 family)